MALKDKIGRILTLVGSNYLKRDIFKKFISMIPQQAFM